MNTIILNLQKKCKKKLYFPSKNKILYWLYNIIPITLNFIEITIRIVDISEIQYLNKYFRKKKYPTNILSFPLLYEFSTKKLFLGDLIICNEILRLESIINNISIENHWLHIIIHGVLHLLGYNHNTNNEYYKMRLIEKKIIKKLGYK